MKNYLYLIYLFIVSFALFMTATLPNTPESYFYNALIIPSVVKVQYQDRYYYKSSTLTKKYQLWGGIEKDNS